MQSFYTITLFIISVFYTLNASSQITIWSEDFDGNGGAGSNWGTLNEDIGFQGLNNNPWYISGVECGNAASICGSSCAGIDASLHVGANAGGFGDSGAAYDATAPSAFCGMMGSLFCDPTTNKRSQSKDINTTGEADILLSFNYIEGGEGTSDDCIIEYSINGGLSWLTLINPPKPPLGACAPQATWTPFSVNLPVSCENIPNLRIAFRWQNNDDGIGTDPSFAVDGIELSILNALPIEMTDFTVRAGDHENILEWTTQSEFNSSHFEIEKSKDGITFEKIAQVKAKGNSTNINNYNTTDPTPINGNNYYRLKLVDLDNSYSYSEVIHIHVYRPGNNVVVFPNPVLEQINLTYYSHNKTVVQIEILDMFGRIVDNKKIQVSEGSNILSLDSGLYPSGSYMLKIYGDNFFNSKLFVKC